MDIIGPYYATDWVGTALALFAVYLLAEKKWYGFLIAITSNFIWGVFGILSQSMGTIVCQVGFFIINCYGIYRWKQGKS